MLENILFAMTNILEWQNLLAMIAGVAVGIIIGAIPGLSVTMAVALLLPVTFSLSASAGMLLLIGVYCGGTYAGSISAVLLKTPGTAASAATAVDGFALAQKGRASAALNMSLYASVFGGVLSGVVLLFFAPQVAKFALRFGPPEYFMLAIFGLTVIAGVSGKSIGKGMVMGFFGVIIATIGLDPIGGVYRFTFGQDYLLSGIDLVPALIGLFAISELFNQIEKGAKKISLNESYKKEKFGLPQLLKHKILLFKSSLIGVIVGIIPGTGPAISSFLGYNEARRTSKKPDEYGHGSMEAVAAAESANNGTTGATLIPMMTLGIPGDAVTAVMLGGLLIQGLAPGPQLFTTHGGFVYTLMVGFIVVQFFMFIQGKIAIRWFSKITQIPSNMLIPLIAIMCLTGAYAVNNSLYSVVFALIFGVIGYILPKYGYPVIPMLIAMVLGPMAEKALRQSLLLSDGSFLVFFTRPIALSFFILVILSVLLPLIGKYRAIRKQKVVKTEMGQPEF